MASISVAGGLDRSVHAASWGDPSPEAAGLPLVVLRVSGSKPLHLRARLLAEGSSWGLNSPAWHEIALYREPEDRVTVAVATFKKAEGESDVHRAASFPGLDEAIQFLEAFDPTADLTVNIDAADPAISTASIALQAAALRQQADTVARQYRALLGQMLYALDTAS